MTDKDDLKTATAGLAIVGELLKAAGNDPAVKEAAGNLGQAALTISKTVNNALLPLAAVNFAFDKAKKYFSEKFESDIAAHAAKIPRNLIVEPKASIAGPALQGLAFTHEEQPLREMFLNLLATSMDARVCEDAHPAFVEIIKQLDSSEAPHLQEILQSPKFIPVVRIMRKEPNGEGAIEIANHIVNFRDKTTNKQATFTRFPVMLDNWVRLGLVVVIYDAWLAAAGSYDWVESRPEFIEALKQDTEVRDRISVTKGYIRVTALGAQFAKAVGARTL
jgi:hypothetical protein